MTDQPVLDPSAFTSAIEFCEAALIQFMLYGNVFLQVPGACPVRPLRVVMHGD